MGAAQPAQRARATLAVLSDYATTTAKVVITLGVAITLRNPAGDPRTIL